MTHPNEEWVMQKSITQLAETRGDQHALQVVKYYGSRRGRVRPVHLLHLREKCWMYYAPVPSTGWSLAVIFPEENSSPISMNWPETWC